MGANRLRGVTLLGLTAARASGSGFDFLDTREHARSSGFRFVLELWWFGWLGRVATAGLMTTGGGSGIVEWSRPMHGNVAWRGREKREPDIILMLVGIYSFFSFLFSFKQTNNSTKC